MQAGQDPAAENIVDNVIGDHDTAFFTNNQNFNWIQIDFGSTVENIDRILVVKRANRVTPSPADVADRFKSIDVRIGDDPVPAGTARTDLASVGNALCLSFAGDNDATAETLECSSPLSGRYMTLQNTVATYLEIDELFIVTT